MAFRLFTVILITTALVGVRVDAMRPGGTSEEKAPNPEVQALIDPLKPEVEARLGHTVSEFTVLGFKTQVVAGINYFVKVDIGEDDVVAHLRVYQKLDQSVELTDLLYPKHPSHPINYF